MVVVELVSGSSSEAARFLSARRRSLSEASPELEAAAAAAAGAAAAAEGVAGPPPHSQRDGVDSPEAPVSSRT